jgi:hypothetical protein
MSGMMQILFLGIQIGSFADANDVIERTNRLSGRINSQRALADKNYKSIPPHANIRTESVKCGKPDCNGCKHGPYYYAYWKENGKKI